MLHKLFDDYFKIAFKANYEIIHGEGININS